jgi:hypothetical protein
MKRMFLTTIATIGFGLSGVLPALANSAGETSIDDVPQTMNCGESFQFTSEVSTHIVFGHSGFESCSDAIAYVNSIIDSYTGILKSRCKGTLQISANTYTPAQGKCSGNLVLGWDYSQQRTVTCECPGTVPGMPTNTTNSVPSIP